MAQGWLSWFVAGEVSAEERLGPGLAQLVRSRGGECGGEAWPRAGSAGTSGTGVILAPGLPERTPGSGLPVLPREPTDKRGKER